jgi:hypothetical protein
MNHLLKRYERVKLYEGGEQADRIIHSVREKVIEQLEFNKVQNLFATISRAKDTFLSPIIFDYHHIIDHEHFEVISLDKSQIDLVLKLITSSMLEYLYGDWRSKCSWHYFNYDSPEGPPYLTVDETRQKMSWVYRFRYGLLDSLLLDDDSSTTKILDWIQPDVQRDSNRSAQTDPSDVEYLMMFRHVFCGNKSDDVSSLKQAIMSQRRCKRTKMLLGCLESIQENDAKTFLKRFVNYMKHAQKSNLLFYDPRSPRSPAALVDIDSCLVWTLAFKLGLDLPILAEELMDYVICPQTLGLD